MADVFLLGGYKTALFGNWHFGYNYPFIRPQDRGFDEVLARGNGMVGKYQPSDPDRKSKE